MSTNAVSSLSILQELQSFYQNRQADFKQLGSALQSGDLAGAQQAYKALAVLGESGPFANSEPFSKSSRTQAFDAIGEALQAGDLARAQASFVTLTAKHTTSPPITPAAIVNLASAQHNIEPLTTNNSSSIYQQLQAFRQQRQTDLAQLGQALQSGDLAGAQAAFDALTALGQSGPNKNGATFARADRNQDFQAIGQALQNSDLAGAQAAFASLSSTFGQQSQQAQTAISAYHAVAAEIVINFGSAPSSNASSGASTGSTTPEVIASAAAVVLHVARPAKPSTKGAFRKYFQPKTPPNFFRSTARPTLPHLKSQAARTSCTRTIFGGAAASLNLFQWSGSQMCCKSFPSCIYTRHSPKPGPDPKRGKRLGLTSKKSLPNLAGLQVRTKVRQQWRVYGTQPPA